jgi:hypothetical protein
MATNATWRVTTVIDTRCHCLVERGPATEHCRSTHASVHRYRLFTLDQRLYRAAFPDLEVGTF